MDDAFYKSAPNLKLVQLAVRRLRPLRHRGRAAGRRADLQQRRRQLHRGVGARDPADAGGLPAHRLAAHATSSAGRWRGNNVDDVKLFELKGRTLGIVGLGTIGKKIARLAQAFGMTVQYYDIIRLTEERADDAWACGSRCSRKCCGPPTSSRCTCR